MAKPPVKQGQPVTWAQAIRDIVVASINKGQLPGLLLGAIGLMMVWRMPENDLGTLAREMFSLADRWHLMGWALDIAILAAWFYFSKTVNRAHNAELTKLGAEKQALYEENKRLKERGPRSNRQ